MRIHSSLGHTIGQLCCAQVDGHNGAQAQCVNRRRSTSLCALFERCTGGVALLAINSDRNASKAVELASASQRYTLTVPDLEGARVELNGTELKLGADDALPQVNGVSAPAGRITLAPASITFLAIHDARNASCR